MLTKQESTLLKSYLALAPDPEATFAYEELQGYLFGLAITPKLLLPGEWVPVIFGDQAPVFDPSRQLEEMHKCLIQVYTKQRAKFQEDKLPFPFTMGELDAEQIEELYAWVSGFEEALALFEELWDPEEYSDIPDQTAQEIYHSLMTVQGLVDPAEVMDFFENMPKEAFEEIFPGKDNAHEDREMQVQMFLLASLPLAVETLQNHARGIENVSSRVEVEEKTAKDTRSKKSGKANIITVDFGRKK